jgi:hypothetical protein
VGADVGLDEDLGLLRVYARREIPRGRRQAGLEDDTSGKEEEERGQHRIQNTKTSTVGTAMLAGL